MDTTGLTAAGEVVRAEALRLGHAALDVGAAAAAATGHVAAAMGREAARAVNAVLTGGAARDVAAATSHAVRDVAAATRASVAATERALEATRAFAAAEARLVAARLRERLGGLDDSESLEKRRARQVARYERLFSALSVTGRGGVPINDLEDAFGLAGLLVARTEVGRLSYEADEDGNGALDFAEFTVVLDKLSAYQTKTASALGSKLQGSFFYGTEGASMTLQQIIWRSLEDPAFSVAARIANIIIIAAILVATGAFILSTNAELGASWGVWVGGKLGSPNAT